jgi:hypothetical protein
MFLRTENYFSVKMKLLEATLYPSVWWSIMTSIFSEKGTGEKPLELIFNKEKVTKLSSEIFNFLDGLRDISSFSKKEFLKYRRLRGSTKYYLIVSIEAAH